MTERKDGVLYSRRQGISRMAVSVILVAVLFDDGVPVLSRSPAALLVSVGVEGWDGKGGTSKYRPVVSEVY